MFQSFIGKGTSNRILNFTFKRNKKIADYLHKSSRFIVNYCKEFGIETIVIGKNVNWKQDVNMGVQNNQNFVSIPFANFIKQIQYKAEEFGIKVVVNNKLKK